MLPTDYIDWLAKVREDGGELAWIRGRPSAEVNKDRRTREQLVKKVLKSLNVKNAVKSMAVETGRSEEELWTEANEIMQNMAHSFGLTSTKAVGYVVLKCLRRLLDKVMVNFEALQKVREIAKRDSVVFMPTHRTYVDFLLLSLLCYDQNLKLPAICAGADFLTSKFVGEALRRCGAFFIRRSFGSDRLYWTLFTEYVQTHLVCNECPIEFFVEGQRSRTSKSLYPKFGLVQVIAEPFLRSHVYDTVVVPVTINYDRLLESFLYGRELLGSPKPKETVSGLLKVRQILNQKFGSVFITFAEPISLRQYFSRIDRASISFRPTAHYIYERSVKNTVAHLAHEVVNLQNKNNILTVWTIAASVLQQEFRQSKVVSRRDTLQKLTQLHELCRQLGFNLWTEQGRSMEDMFNYYVVELYHDLFKISDDHIQLLSVDAEKSKELPEELLSEAIPSVVLANAANPFIYELSDFGFVLLACQNDHIKKQDLGRKFEFLRGVFEREFVHKPMTSNEDLEKILNLLQKVGIVRIENEFVLVVDKEKALWITKIVEPFLHAYSTIMEIILQANPDEQNGTLLQTCWKQLSSIVKQPSSSIDLAHLSSDLIKNVISLMNKVDGNQLDGEDNQKRAKQMILDLLNEVVNPTNKSVRSRI